VRSGCRRWRRYTTSCSRRDSGTRSHRGPNEFVVYLIKYSSLAAFITVPELYYRADQIASETFRYTLIFVVTGLTYLALVLTASKLMERVEERVAIPGLGTESQE